MKARHGGLIRTQVAALQLAKRFSTDLKLFIPRISGRWAWCFGNSRDGTVAWGGGNWAEKVMSTPRGLAVLREGSSVQSSASQRLRGNHMSSTRGMGKEEVRCKRKAGTEGFHGTCGM